MVVIELIEIDRSKQRNLREHHHRSKRHSRGAIGLDTHRASVRTNAGLARLPDEKPGCSSRWGGAFAGRLDCKTRSQKDRAQVGEPVRKEKTSPPPKLDSGRSTVSTGAPSPSGEISTNGAAEIRAKSSGKVTWSDRQHPIPRCSPPAGLCGRGTSLR